MISLNYQFIVSDAVSNFVPGSTQQAYNELSFTANYLPDLSDEEGKLLLSCAREISKENKSASYGIKNKCTCSPELQPHEPKTETACLTSETEIEDVYNLLDSTYNFVFDNATSVLITTAKWAQQCVEDKDKVNLKESIPAFVSDLEEVVRSLSFIVKTYKYATAQK